MTKRGPLDTDVAIETPEHIVFRYRVAGPTRRCLAYIIDLLACYGAFFGIAIVVILATAGSHGVGETMSTAMGAGLGLLMLIVFFIQWIYFV
ncbi:MAG: RDD family protein, partial [Polyangiaceae bacterium]